jgi:hypothetical protein
MCNVRQILFLPLGIFDSYVSLIQNKLFFGTLRRISNLTNLAVTSWAFSWFLSPGLYGMLHGDVRAGVDVAPLKIVLTKYTVILR